MGSIVANTHRVPLRAFLWEYLGHPEDETAERRRILYAIVILRLGFGLFFLLRGWGAVFGDPTGALAARLGDPARLGLGGAAADTTLFILGCTELGVGVLLLFGAFTRVSAVTGTLLLLLSLALGDRSALAANATSPFAGVPTLIADLTVLYLPGLALLVIAGSPFMSADRALDKLEEEERDRPPASLPRLAERQAWLFRAGIALALVWLAVAARPVQGASQAVGINISAVICLLLLGLALVTPIAAIPFSGLLLVWALVRGEGTAIVLALPLLFSSLAFSLASLPRGEDRRPAEPVRVQQT